MRGWYILRSWYSVSWFCLFIHFVKIIVLIIYDIYIFSYDVITFQRKVKNKKTNIKQVNHETIEWERREDHGGRSKSRASCVLYNYYFMLIRLVQILSRPDLTHVVLVAITCLGNTYGYNLLSGLTIFISSTSWGNHTWWTLGLQKILPPVLQLCLQLTCILVASNG